MSKISDLTKAINDSTAKELQNIEQTATSVIKQSLSDIQNNLQSVQRTMQNDLKDLQASNSKALSETAQQLKADTDKLKSDSRQIIDNTKAQLETLAQQMIQPLEQIQQNSNEKALTIAKNRWLWLMLGLVGALILVLMLWSMILAKNITAQHAELANIKQASQQSPIQQQALAKLSIGQNNDGTIWIEPKNPKKAEVGKSTDGKPLMLLK